MKRSMFLWVYGISLLRSIVTNNIPRYGYQTFKNPKPNLLSALKESGPTFGEENGVKPKRESESAKKKRRPDKGVCLVSKYPILANTDRGSVQIDMEKLADNLQRLGEDDLLQVVSMVHENKTADTYTKNDVERKLPGLEAIFLLCIRLT